MEEIFCMDLIIVFLFFFWRRIVYILFCWFECNLNVCLSFLYFLLLWQYLVPYWIGIIIIMFISPNDLF